MFSQQEAVGRGSDFMAVTSQQCLPTSDGSEKHQFATVQSRQPSKYNSHPVLPEQQQVLLRLTAALLLVRSVLGCQRNLVVGTFLGADQCRPLPDGASDQTLCCWFCFGCSCCRFCHLWLSAVEKARTPSNACCAHCCKPAQAVELPCSSLVCAAKAN